MLADIDLFFKKVNDTYGHPVGDRGIKGLADVSSSGCVTDIGRYMALRVAVVLPDTDADTALRVIEDICQRFAEILHPPNRKTCPAPSAAVSPGTARQRRRQNLSKKRRPKAVQRQTRGRNCSATHPA
jgi:diguanylate cyclase (GGDEF)-like protein